MCLKRKLEGSTGHVGNGRKTQSLGEWMGGQTKAEQNEVLVPFIQHLCKRGGEKERGDRTGQE
jgi:hypothetical protein